MSSLVTSFRLPPNLEGKAEPEVVEAIGFHDDAITDLQNAIPSLKSQIDALKSSSSSSSTTQNVTNNTETTIINTSTIGMVNDQTGNTSYSTQQTDYGAFITLSDSSAIAIMLTQGTAITVPWYVSFINLGTGTATLTPETGLINGAASFALPGNNGVTVAYDGANFWIEPTSAEPVNTPAVTHEWLNSYDSSTGDFGQTQPAYSDISGTPQLPVTITDVAHEFLTSYTSGTGLFTQAQPVVADVSGAAPSTNPTFTGAVTQPTPSVVTAATTATSATAGAASALPATPLGYLEMSVNGVTVKIPYYSV